MFYILQGNNGATYIVNAKDRKSINDSLKFYKARNFKSKFLTAGFKVLLFIQGKLYAKKLKSGSGINEYLQKISQIPCEFGINDNSSVLISPTRDKIIVHQHNDYFQKFAFGKSYEKVKNEATIYNIFSKNLKAFQVSNFYDFHDEKDKYCSFKLSNEHLKIGKNETPKIVPALLEFFKTTSKKTCNVSEYVENLENELDQFKVLHTKTQKQVLESIKTNYGALEFPLGLVHRDFKPWNVLDYEKPLIFDFEEAVVDGPPLEDFFNYLIDPILMYRTIEEVYKCISDKKNIKFYKLYLDKLHLKVDFELFLKIYIINRILFWKSLNKTKTSLKYIELLEYVA